MFFSPKEWMLILYDFFYRTEVNNTISVKHTSMQKVGKFSLRPDGSVVVNMYKPKSEIFFINTNFVGIESRLSDMLNMKLVMKSTSDKGGEIDVIC